ncbi:MAG: chemotaxis protein CheB [Planctomycetota bacterium]
MSAANQVIAIGASAGGLEPLQAFFKALPDDTGHAYVVIQHLSPDYPSLMDELLSRHTQMPVRRVEDGMLIEADTVYVIPPKTHMHIEDGHLRLTEQSRKRDTPPMPIDVFFESLAEQYGERGSAVVLSGTGSDGSRGIPKVREAGGRTVVQDSTAKFDGMPTAATRTGAVDMILPPEEMPSFLLGLEDEAGERPSLVNTSPDVAEVLKILNKRHGLDFSQYKITTVLRRIARRIQLTHRTSVENYVSMLNDDEQEQDRLYRDLLIGVTRFFRDQKVFEKLSDEILPDLLQKPHVKEDGLRIWIAGCASGEEAYSVAMLVAEAMRDMPQPVSTRIFATDVHRGSIDFASSGRYSKEHVADIPKVLLDRYFTYHGEDVQVNTMLRGMVTFAPHNLIADAPFTRMDMVICRNLLIYLKPSSQHRALARIHFALRPKGTLILGSSETVSSLGNEFETLDAHWRVYRKKRDVRLVLDDVTAISPRSELHMSQGPAALVPAPRNADTRIQRAYDALLADMLPAGMLLNERRELVHTFGDAQQLLRPPQGRISLDILDLVDNELRIALGSVLVRVARERRAMRYGNVRVKFSEGEKVLDLEVKPLNMPPADAPYFLVTLREIETRLDVPEKSSLPAAELVPSDEMTSHRIEELEDELQHTKENLQATIEEMETTNEELNATNEELIASNEELQSTNEELQSVNEELHTVNSEHQQKITELTGLTDDMDNLLASTEIGTIFLDQKMCVRKFTPAVQDHFRLRPQDLGRPLIEISTRIARRDLIDICEEVFETGEKAEFKSKGDGPPVLIRITPYITRKGFIDGVVISIVDVRTLVEAEEQIAELARQNQLILDHIPAMVWYKDRDSRIMRANKAAADAYGLEVKDIEGKTTQELHPEMGEKYVRDDLKVIEGGRAVESIIERFDREENEISWISTDKVPMRNEYGEINGLLTVATDISTLMQAQEDLKQVSQRLELAMIGADQALWEWRPKENEVYYNEHWFTMLGYRPNEMSASYDTWKSLVHPEDFPRAEESLLQCARGEIERHDAITRMRCKDGSWRWVRTVGRVVEGDGEGNASLISGTHIDIDSVMRDQIELKKLNADLEAMVKTRTAELEHARARFERAVQGSQQGVWEWNVETEDCWFSSKFWQLLGFAEGAEVPPDSFTSLMERIHADEADEARTLLTKTAKEGEPLDGRYRLRMSDGGFRWFSVRAIQTLGEEGDPARLSGSIVDIHDSVVGEVALQSAKNELEARVEARTSELSEHVESLADRNEQLDQFAHVASHDLRAPLRSITANAELAMRKVFNGTNGSTSPDHEADPTGKNVEAKPGESGGTDSAEHLRRIIGGAKRMNALLDGLSAYSSVGRATITLDTVELSDLCRDIMSDLACDIETSSAEVRFGDMPTVIADGRLMRQVMQNLITNGLKFTGDKAPVVEVSAEDRPKETLVRVTDNGIGIDPQYADAIFEPFRRLHTATEYPGSGVGLSVCRRIIERHGGQIWVDQSVESGTSFCFSIPKVPSPTPETASGAE